MHVRLVQMPSHVKPTKDGRALRESVDGMFSGAGRVGYMGARGEDREGGHQVVCFGRRI